MTTASQSIQPHTMPDKVITPAAASRRIVDGLSPTKRQEIGAFKIVLEFLLSVPVAKDSTPQKIAEFQRQFTVGLLPDAVQLALNVIRGKKAGQCPDRATLYRWLDNLDKFQGGYERALTKQHAGRQRKVWGWESKAVELFNLPSKPAYATVGFWLRTDHGYESATKTRVTAYLKTLPATLGKQSPLRMGKTFYKHNLAPHKIRDNEVLPVGWGYEGDGHTVDVYVAHPQTGGLYRPELTIWIDIRSRMVVGWYLEKSESAISTLFALSEALLSHDHVPAMLFLDNGSGFASRMMADEVTGFMSRLSITPSFCLPGNSKGKGLVEGFNKIFRDLHDKKFQTYCGDDMAEEINRRLPDLVKSGKRKLPSLEEYAASVRKFIADYNNEPKPVLNGEKPIDLWAGLERVPLYIAADALVQPRELRTVQRWRIRLDNRVYEAAELAQYNGKELMVEYSLHHDGEIRVLDADERLICIAKLVGKDARVPESRMVEVGEKQLRGAVKRKQNQIAELEQRSKPVISSAASSQDLIDIMPTNRTTTVPLNFNADDALYLGAKRIPAADEINISDCF